MGNRMYRQQAGKTRVESKKDYISRGYESPDEADSLTLVINTVRVNAQVVIEMAGGASMPGNDDYYGSPYPDGCYIDPTNRTDTLDLDSLRDDEMRERWQQMEEYRRNLDRGAIL
jgi:hypothetical protein